MSDSIDLRALLGLNLQRLRLEGGATHGDLERAASPHGLDRPASWFADVERGARPVSAEELISLPFVLADATHRAVALADLLVGEEPIRLTTESTPMPPATIRSVLTAPPQPRAFVDDHAPKQLASRESALTRAAERAREIREAGFGEIDVRVLAHSEDGAGDRERRLARRLGVPRVVVVAACAALWGRSLTEQRAALLREPDAPPTAAIMRRLTGEITREIARHAGAAVPEPAVG